MIAVDVMGGDFAPHVVLQGAVQAAKEGNKVCLFGPEAVIKAWLEIEEETWRQLPITLVDATETIEMTDEPVGAVRKKQNSSLVRAVKSVACGDATAVVSAGHSGALMVASIFVLGRQDGIERPAIAGLFPTPTGYAVGLDLGANTDCKAVNLVQFAHLGVEYARRMLAIKHPRVALLANGEEDVKGSLLTKEAFQLLQQEAALDFIGNREPHAALSGEVDVFVCDGFTGNIFLKTFETVFAQRTRLFKELLTGLNVDPSVLGDLKKRLDAANVLKQMGGALLIGVQKPVFVCHGAAQAGDITQAIRTASKYVKTDKNGSNVSI